MTIAELQEQVQGDLDAELKSDTDYNEEILEIKVRNAIREVKTRRNYPESYTDEMIANDLERFYSTITALAVYDYNQIGAQGQSLHTEDDVQRSWYSRDEILGNIPAFVKVL